MLLIARKSIPCGQVHLLGAIVVAFGCLNGAAGEADSSFVGLLALTNEEDVADRLGLSDEVKSKLIELIDRREDEALAIVLAGKDLPPAEQAARLVPLVAESERQGFALLTVAQREKLQQIRIARQGMISLAEPGLAQLLGLSEQQQATVEQLLAQRAVDLTEGGGSVRRITRAVYERKLAAVLTDGQRTDWQKMAGLTDATETPKENEDAAAESPQKQSAVSDSSSVKATPSDREDKSTDSRPDRRAAQVPTGKLRFRFDRALWKDVLEWFAEQADLAPAIDNVPLGTFTYKDDRAYTVDQAIDLLNSYLLTKGYTLVRRERMLLVLDLENPIPEELVTLVTIQELDQRGRYELVKCLFLLVRMKAEDAAEMIKNYLGPQGDVIPFPNARQILVTETAGKLRTIRDMIARVEDPEAGGAEMVLQLNLEHVSSEDALAIARPLLGLGLDQNANEDISISVDSLGTTIYATGRADSMQLLRELIPLIDKEPATSDADETEPENLEPRTYPIRAASPDLLLRVLQTMLAGVPGARLEVDSTSRKLIAMAHPSEHKMIEDTIKLLEGDTMEFEVIPVERIDPQLAVAAINKFFGLSNGNEDDENSSIPNGPVVGGDPINGNVWVRGTVVQIEQIKDLIAKLDGPRDKTRAGGNALMIPLSGSAARAALESAGQLWTRKNRIRLVTPAARTRTEIRLQTTTPLEEAPGADAANREPHAPVVPKRRDAGQANPPAADPTSQESSAGRSASRRSALTNFHFASQLQTSEMEKAEPAQPNAADALPAEIRVAITPGGIFIASDDLEAADEFEDLLRAVSGPSTVLPQREITVFYLKYARADVARTLLQEILSGHTDDSSGSLLGDMASNLLGGGLLGSLAGGLAEGGGDTGDVTTLQASGLVNIVPDPRLNALVVEANQSDLDLIEQLLEVIDRESSLTKVETSGMPRLIPVVYAGADEVAAVVNQVFADRLATTGRGGQQQQPLPDDLVRVLRDRRGGTANRPPRGEEQKMTIGVEPRSNALIVTAPDPLFRQVEALVKQIDQPGNADSDIVEVVPIKVSTPELVKETLEKVLENTTARQRTSVSGEPTAAPSGGAAADQARRRMELFQRLRNSGALRRSGGGTPSAGGGRSGARGR